MFIFITFQWRPGMGEKIAAFMRETFSISDIAVFCNSKQYCWTQMLVFYIILDVNIVVACQQFTWLTEVFKP